MGKVKSEWEVRLQLVSSVNSAHPSPTAWALVQVKCTAGTKALEEGAKSLHQVGSIIHSRFGVLGSVSSPKVPMWLKIQVPPKYQQLSGLGNGTGALISFHHRCQACHQRDSSLTHGSHVPDHAPPRSIKQETSERQKGSPQLLLSNQAIANYKEHTPHCK